MGGVLTLATVAVLPTARASAVCLAPLTYLWAASSSEQAGAAGLRDENGTPTGCLESLWAGRPAGR